ncbi:MAG TPA: MFS transporter [Candidatus Limnocylindria bacterium]|jgi:MFS family permease
MTTRTSVPAIELIRHPNFGALWLAQVASRFGDPVTLIALTYVSYVRTHSALITALAVVMATIPNALFGVFGGVLADAAGHRRAMIICDLARFALVGSVPITLVLSLPLIVPYALVFAAAACGAIFNPARLALVPRVVSAQELPSANALTYSSDRAVEVLGALAAGLLVASLGERAFYVDALTFLISAALLLRVRVDEQRRAFVFGAIGHEALGGLRFLWRHAVLRANTLFSLACQLSLPVVASLAPSLIFQRFAAGNAELGASEFGIAEGAIAAGAVASGLLIVPALAGIPKGRLLLVGFAVYGVVLIALAVAPTFEIALVLFALGGVVNVLFYVSNVTISQELTPPDLRARVFGARIALLNLSWLPVIVASGALADLVSVPLLIAVAGVVTLVCATVGAFIPIVRDVA